MKSALVPLALLLALGVDPAHAQALQGAGPCEDPALLRNADGTCGPAVVLPDGQLPVGEATNLVFLAPVVGGLLGVAALAGAGGGSTGSTPSTVNK